MRAWIALVVLVLALPLAGAESQIDVLDEGFSPPRALVSEWETVRWTWPEDEVRSIVDATTGEAWCAARAGGCTFFFARAGDYAYHDAADPTRRGVVQVVRQAAAEPSALRASFRVQAQGLVATFDASASASSRTAIASYEWDFGDGGSLRCVDGGCVAEGGASETRAGGGRIVQHAYARPGTYVARLTLTDEDGAHASNGRRIQLAFPGDPDAYFWTNTSGLVVQLDAAPRDGARRWDFGDGSSLYCDSGCEASVDTVANAPHSVLHVYRRSGVFLVNHSVGGSWAASYVTVAAGERIRIDADGLAIVVDASALPRYGNATVRWLFGDLARAEGERARHAFSEPGTWTIEATLQDDVGEWTILDEVVLTGERRLLPAVATSLLAAEASDAAPRLVPAQGAVAILAIAAAIALGSKRYK